MEENVSFEKLNDKISVCISKEHGFGTDAFLLANFAMPRMKDKVCDLGTGCGIIPLIMCKKNLPKEILAVDIQPKAIAQLNMSLEKCELNGVITPLLSDLKELSKEYNDSFDVVTCNPPYKANGAGILSSTSADKVARHETMCTIEDICKTASRLLKFGGRFCLCQRPERLSDVIYAMKQSSLEPKRLRLVAKTPNDKPWLFLIEGKKGSKPFMTVDPTLCVYDGKEFSKEMIEIYGFNLSENEE